MTWYTTGTVAVTNGSTDVIATGTQFITNTKPGDIFVVLTDGMIYEIDEIVSATQLKLKRAYAGSTGDGLQYEVVPTASYLKTLANQVADLIALYTKVPEEVAASASAASDSAKAAATSAATAASSASGAIAAKAAAATSETNAANSASAAAASETAAATSEFNAALSASTASRKAEAAAASAAATATSAVNAASSAAAAATSEQNAAAAVAEALKNSNNLSDVADKAAARANLDVPGNATLNAVRDSKVSKTGDTMTDSLRLKYNGTDAIGVHYGRTDGTTMFSAHATPVSYAVARHDATGKWVANSFGIDSSGNATFEKRPAWAGATPWDTGNFDPNSKINRTGDTITGVLGLAANLPDADKSLLYNDSGTRNLVVRTGPSSAYKWTVIDDRGCVTSSAALNTSGAFRSAGNIGTAFSAWNTVAVSALQVDAADNAAAYIGMRWTRWGERHLASISCYAGGSNATGAYMAFMVDGDDGPTFRFYRGGNGTYSGSWQQASDYRLKTNLTSVSTSAALDKLLRLKPLEYDRVEPALAGQRFSGFLAHEAQDDFPHLVRGMKDGTRVEHGAHGFPSTVADYQSVDYIGFVPYLVAALQEVVVRIKSLEETVAAK